MLIAVVLSLGVISSCGDSPEDRRTDAYGRQLDALIELQGKRDQIARKILSYDFVGSARVFFPSGGVIAEITLKSREEIGAERFQEIDVLLKRMADEVNVFITGLTGFSKENISLRVRPSG